MIIPQKRLASGFALPVLGYGTWQLGGRYERDPNNDDARDVRAICTAIDLGFTHIDTAELYGDGHAESSLARQCVRTSVQHSF